MSAPEHRLSRGTAVLNPLSGEMTSFRSYIGPHESEIGHLALTMRRQRNTGTSEHHRRRRLPHEAPPGTIRAGRLASDRVHSGPASRTPGDWGGVGMSVRLLAPAATLMTVVAGVAAQRWRKDETTTTPRSALTASAR